MMTKERIKILALLVVIGMPVFFILMFKNLKKIPRPRTPEAMFVDSVKVTKDEEGKDDSTNVYYSVPNFKFQTQYGDSLELDSLRGVIYVANFFYATCPGICPVMINNMAKVQDAFSKDELIRLVSITVDPEVDDAKTLLKYANRNNAIPGKWYFLRTSRENTFTFAEKGLKLSAIANSPNELEKIAHSERFVLVDWEGHIRGYYSGTDSAKIVKLSQDAFMLKRAYESGRSYSFGRNK